MKVRIPQWTTSLAIFLLYCLSANLQAASRPRILTSVDDSARVRLPATHLNLENGIDLGAIEPSQRLDRMILVLAMAPEQQHEVATLLDRQQTKGSPDYHRWLTPDQYGQMYGPAEEDLSKVTGWLQQQGFTSVKPARSGMWIEFSGTVGLVNRVFQTEMRSFQVGTEIAS